jgi:hypothetical protein
MTSERRRKEGSLENLGAAVGWGLAIAVTLVHQYLSTV